MEEATGARPEYAAEALPYATHDRPFVLETPLLYARHGNKGQAAYGERQTLKAYLPKTPSALCGYGCVRGTDGLTACCQLRRHKSEPHAHHSWRMLLGPGRLTTSVPKEKAGAERTGSPA